MGIQLLLVTCTGAMATDMLLSAIGSVRDIGSEDVGFLIAILAVLVAGLVIGHVLRSRISIVELVSVPIAFVGAGIYLLDKLGVATTDAKLAIACALMGSFTTSLSLLDAFPAGEWLANRRGGLIDDGAVFTLAIVASTLATRAFVTSPLIDMAWLVPTIILAGTGVLGSLVIRGLRKEKESATRGLPSIRHPLLAILRGHLLGLGIVVFMLVSFELHWIIDELFIARSTYAIVSEQVVNTCVLLAGLAWGVSGAAAAKACLLARRRTARIVAALLLVFVPILIPGALLAASIVLDWMVAGATTFLFVAGHVAGMILQFTDSGYKGSPGIENGVLRDIVT
jgi:hypothetical protein